MSQTQETSESLNDDETAPAVPVMTTVERAEMLLRQDAAIRDRIGAGATLDEAVDPSNKETSYGGNTKQNGGRPAGPYTFRRFKSRTPIGMIGNANMASPEKGKRLVDQMTVRLAELIADLW